MKKPVKRQPDYIVDRQGTRWYGAFYDNTWYGFDNFNGLYFITRGNSPVPLTGIWDQ